MNVMQERRVLKEDWEVAADW